jgi:DNA-binding NarL/FixJ family response regulator
MAIRVSIVEDNRGTRENLVALVKGEARLTLLSSYSTGEAAVVGIAAEKPDVALVDINLPRISGIECVARLRTLAPTVQVLMLTTYEEADLIFDSLRAGAKGYLLKKLLPAELIQAVEQVHAGGAPMSMEIARKIVDHFGHPPSPAAGVEKLTKREQEVLALLARGHLYKEIADALQITLHTVQGHVKHIYEKLQVQSRMEAARKFLGRE